jgi:hypothetical protein
MNLSKTLFNKQQTTNNKQQQQLFANHAAQHAAAASTAPAAAQHAAAAESYNFVTQRERRLRRRQYIRRAEGALMGTRPLVDGSPASNGTTHFIFLQSSLRMGQKRNENL